MDTATYSPEDNKLRLYPAARLDAETYARVRAAGFIWAAKQGLFVAPAWTPNREDLLTELCGEVGDEDTSLVDRAEERSERFEGYGEKRSADAESAHAAVAAITHGIPMGQPILIGHHSERHARKDAERIKNGMRRAVKMWETAKYWESRAAGAIAHAKYKERPDVRARRIKGLEADERKQLKIRERAVGLLRIWTKLPELKRKDGTVATPRQVAIYVANGDGGTFSRSYTHRSGYVGPLTLWEAAGGNIHDEDPETVAYATVDEVRAQAIRNHEATIAWAERWLTHLAGRLSYERAMLGESGGTVADKTGPEVGGGCRCWASPRGGWSYIVKVNKVSVSVLDNWGNGGGNFKRTVPFDKLAAIMTRADVEAARAAGLLVDTADGVGFGLLTTPGPVSERPACKTESAQAQDAPASGERFEAMKATLRAGVSVVSVPQLFPTPRDLAQRMVDMADIQPGHRVLEPSAGTGAILGAMGGRMYGATVDREALLAVEIDERLCSGLRRDYPVTRVLCGDFLAQNGNLGTFDRVVMNPPFGDAADIKHIRHAFGMLRPGGRLVALCANGPRQQEQLKAEAVSWEELPSGTFDGTGGRAALLVLEA